MAAGTLISTTKLAPWGTSDGDDSATACVAGGDGNRFLPSKKTFITFHNTGGAEYDVVFTSKSYNGRDLSTAQLTHAIAAGATRTLGPFEPDQWAQSSGDNAGYGHFTAENAAVEAFIFSY